MHRKGLALSLNFSSKVKKYQISALPLDDFTSLSEDSRSKFGKMKVPFVLIHIIIFCKAFIR